MNPTQPPFANARQTWAVCFDDPLPYLETQALQERLLAARIADVIPDTLLLLEHRPVVTLGRRGRDHYLLQDQETLRCAGVDVVTSTRGGDVTFHGPGQCVVYPIVSVNDLATGSAGYLSMLEDWAIATLNAYNVHAFRRDGMAGAWTDKGKAAAIGFRLKRWVSYHGMSLNVDLDLSGFDPIVGCGLEGEKVSSLKQHLGKDCPTVADVQETMLSIFEALNQREIDRFSPDQVPNELGALL